MEMYDAELAFVEALREATVREVITWTKVPDDDRDIRRAEVDGDILEVEFMSFPVAVGGTFEVVLATVSGLKTYFQVAAGTPAFLILMSMLAQPQAWQSGVKGIGKATARVRKVLEDAQ